MPSSTAKREKLVGPLQLALIGVLFAVSFFYLLPKQDAFTISEVDEVKDDDAVIGEDEEGFVEAYLSESALAGEEFSV